MRGAARGIAVSLLAALVLAGCGRFPQIDFANLRYVAALRTACSAKNAGWLAETKAAIDQEREAGGIGDEEFAAYGEIVAMAEAGEWEEAEEECVRFQRDQLAE